MLWAPVNSSSPEGIVSREDVGRMLLALLTSMRPAPSEDEVMALREYHYIVMPEAPE